MPGTHRDAPRRISLALIFAALAWPLVAFGGTAAPAALPYGIACLLLLVLVRPVIDGALDRSINLVACVVIAQCVPLPAAIGSLLSPHRKPLRDALTLAGPADETWSTLTIHRPSTLWALLVLLAAIAVFWMARAQFSRGGVRRTVRMVSVLGAAVSLLAVAQAATAGRNIYWRFPTEFEGPLPFGPFVNRNHFATWIIMALPLSVGYAAARSRRAAPRPRHVSARSRLAGRIDPRTAWLLTAAVAMTVALLLSLSRSAMLALALSGAVTLFFVRPRLDRTHGRTLLATTAVVVVLGLAWADLPALRGRVAGVPTALADRATIWRETVPIVRDFWITGTGAGTYQRAMYVYQRADRTVFFNQAHNHYLQAAAEGGLALIAALGYALLCLARTIGRRIAGDTSEMVWVRIGAACGLGAVALQSVGETGLAMPANAALAAVLTAVAVYERGVD
ncbi:MAG TPA: O-antigen ligase family protein [Vicinamibacterales bacterium]|nr:O-antigen ligase family protein [Vicinamibacterales bacterium]